jgi:hypoxanthine phosphoribosyltransferase
MERELLISRDRIQQRVKELALEITSDHLGTELVLIGVLKGAVFFFSDLARELKMPADIDFVRAASYGSSDTSSGIVRFTKDVEIEVEGKCLVVVEDIVDTGLTLAGILDEMRKKNPASVKVCVLVDKLERRKVDIPIDYCGFRIERGFVVGYGLDYDEKYRNLCEIYTLKGS